jgi:hypothetical protein
MFSRYSSIILRNSEMAILRKVGVFLAVAVTMQCVTGQGGMGGLRGQNNYNSEQEGGGRQGGRGEGGKWEEPFQDRTEARGGGQQPGPVSSLCYVFWGSLHMTVYFACLNSQLIIQSNIINLLFRSSFHSTS